MSTVGADSHRRQRAPLRTEQDKSGLISGVAEGNIAVICSDHQPHGTDAKLVLLELERRADASHDHLLKEQRLAHPHLSNEDEPARSPPRQPRWTSLPPDSRSESPVGNRYYKRTTVAAHN